MQRTAPCGKIACKMRNFIPSDWNKFGSCLALDTSFVTVLVLLFVQFFTSSFANIFLILVCWCIFSWQKIMGCNKICNVLKLRKILFCMNYRTFLFTYYFNWLILLIYIILYWLSLLFIIAFFAVIVKFTSGSFQVHLGDYFGVGDHFGACTDCLHQEL